MSSRTPNAPDKSLFRGGSGATGGVGDAREWEKIFDSMRVAPTTGAKSSAKGAGREVSAAGTAGNVARPALAASAMRPAGNGAGGAAVPGGARPVVRAAPPSVVKRGGGAPVVVIRSSGGGGLGPVQLIVLVLLAVALAAGAFLVFSGERVTRVGVQPPPVPPAADVVIPDVADIPVVEPRDDGALPVTLDSSNSRDTPPPDSDGEPEVPDGDGDVVGDEGLPKSPRVASPPVKFTMPYTVAASDKVVSPVRRSEKDASALDKEVWEKCSPTPQNPVAVSQVLEALVSRYMRIPFEKVVAHPVASVFPGAVPENAPRITKVVRLPAAVGRLQSTGIYAAPGELITVTIDNAAVRRGLSVQIGCHSDNLLASEKVKHMRRFPMLIRSAPLDKPLTRIANPFGGPVYILTPGGRAGDRSTLRVQIKGGVEAPLFRLGVTSDAEWQRSRTAPAPWGELVCRTIVISVKSEFLRNLDHPARLMRLWERIIDDQDWLAGLGKRTTSPERLVPDEQISAGYMHSGYPVMCHLDACGSMTSYESLTTHGNWGFFHEYGHNRQRDEWTYTGYGETTCNLFSLFNMERIAGKKVGGPGNERDAFLRDVLRDPAAATGSDHYLSIYIPVIKAFGWESLQKTFAEFTNRKNPSADIRRMRGDNARVDERLKREQASQKGRKPRETVVVTSGEGPGEFVAIDTPGADGAVLPKTASERRAAKMSGRIEDVRKEALVRIWSRHTKHNLGPYFARCGFPYTDAMKSSLSKYQPWMAPEVKAFDAAAKGAAGAAGSGASSGAKTTSAPLAARAGGTTGDGDDAGEAGE